MACLQKLPMNHREYYSAYGQTHTNAGRIYQNKITQGRKRIRRWRQVYMRRGVHR